MEPAVAYNVATFLYLPSILLALGFSILIYVLEALAVQTIARRRGVNHPWLAWLPIGGVPMWWQSVAYAPINTSMWSGARSAISARRCWC